MTNNTPVTPALSAIRASDGQFSISWTATGTENHKLQFSADLTPASWQNVADVPSVANRLRTLSVPTSNSHRFFRSTAP